MNDLNQILNILKAQFTVFQEKYGISSLGVFGSYARGDFNESSDLDILVDFKFPITLGLFEYVAFQNELGDLLGHKVDLVTKSGLKPGIGKSVLQEVVYI